MHYSYDTVVEAIEGLRKRGYSKDFNLAFDKLLCSNKEICLHPEDFEITEVHRFEGQTDPGDENVVYAVESKDGKYKGVITSAFGKDADPVSTNMLKKLSMHTH